MLTDEERAEPDSAATAAPPARRSGVAALYHYSEDGTIRNFAPYVPPTNPSHPPAVWAIDEQHSPLYWFPRHCPRLSVWADTPEQRQRLTDRFATEATRIVAAEISWLDRIREAHLHRYTFDGSQFEPWAEADGQYICGHAVQPLRVDLVDDLLALHVAAQVELRFTPRLGELMDQVLASGLPFGFVRIRDAQR